MGCAVRMVDGIALYDYCWRSPAHNCRKAIREVMLEIKVLLFLAVW